MTILYSNGCSYTANQWVQEDQKYPYLISKNFGWSLLDRSQPGACNDRIIRCTIRDCINLLEKNEPIVALVQLTHLARTEYAGEPVPGAEWKLLNDNHYASIKPTEADLPKEVERYMESHLRLFDHQATMTKLMSNLIGLTCFFKQHNISYLIFNGPEELNQFVPENFYIYLKQDKGVLDLKKFNMLSLTGKQSHPDPQGMQMIAEYFTKLLSNVN